ncbi:MAG: hypothetical protein EBR82_74545 [Caulobacteraceae bacterium]|nr:hypothetical protein [Caulobacteraceae bacterium]
MALDPQDPLIPLPWQMGNIRAYRAQRALETEKAKIDYQKALMDIQDRMRETPEGRITEAEELARRSEQVRQQREGIPMGKVASEAALRGGMNLLEASKAQGEYDVNQRVLATRQAAIENILAGGKGLIPTANVDVGGITQTVPSGMAPQIAVDTQVNFYNAARNKYREVYRNQGYNDIESEKMANEKAASVVEKNSNSGKINLLLSDGSTLSVELGKAMEMAKDPSTPPAIKQQLTSVFGQPQQSTASSWVTKSLGR